MVETATIQAEEREETGSNRVFKLRKEGFLPAVLYGNGKDNLLLKCEKQEFMRAFSDAPPLYELEFDGDAEVVKIKNIQWDHLGEDALHVDFVRVSLDKPIEVQVPVETTGTSSVLSGTGAYMEQHLMTLTVTCDPDNIPEEIPVPIDNLDIGDTVHVKDVVFPEGVEPAMADDRLILSVHEAREILAEEEEAEVGPTAMEPELVGEEEELEPGEEEAEVGVEPAEGEAESEEPAE